jgi:hypothetical protein
MRSFKYIIQPHFLISVILVGAYAIWRSQSRPDASWSALSLSVIAGITNVFKAGIRGSAISTASFLLKVGIIVDAYVVLQDTSHTLLLLAILMSLWLTVPNDEISTDVRSLVQPLLSIADWKTARAQEALIVFCNPSHDGTVVISTVFAKLSAETSSDMRFYLVDVEHHPDIAKAAKAIPKTNPVIVMYKGDKEIERIPTTPETTVSPLMFSEKSLRTTFDLS